VCGSKSTSRRSAAIRTARSLSVRSSRCIMSNMARRRRDVESGTHAPSSDAGIKLAFQRVAFVVSSAPWRRAGVDAGMTKHEKRSRPGTDNHLIATCATIPVQLPKIGALVHRIIDIRRQLLSLSILSLYRTVVLVPLPGVGTRRGHGAEPL